MMDELWLEDLDWVDNASSSSSSAKEQEEIEQNTTSDDAREPWERWNIEKDRDPSINLIPSLLGAPREQFRGFRIFSRYLQN